MLGIRWGSLRTKIIAWSFVPTAIILGAVAWVTLTAYQQVTEDLVVERNQELTRISAARFGAGLTEYTGLLTEYAGLLGGLPRVAYAYEGDLAVQRDVLRRARSRFQVFDGGVFICNNQGTVVATEPDRPDILQQNWANRPYFRHMLRSPEPIFSDAVADGPGGAEVIVVAVPIRGDQGQFLGIIAGLFRLDAPRVNPFYTDIARLDIGQSDNAYLVDGQGRVIYHSNLQRIGADLSEQPVVQRVLSGEIGAVRTRDLNGQDIVASFAPVPGTPWGLITEETWAALISSSRGYQRFLLLLLVLGVLVPASVVAIGVRRITRPITELIGAAQEVARGNFGQTITAQTGDEVEELARQFNLMATHLQQSYARLERGMAARTKELATLNAIAATVNQSQDLEEILSDALDKTLQVMEIEGAGIYLLDEEAGVLSIAAHRGLGSQFVQAINRLRVGEGFSGRVVQSGQPLVVRDISTDRRLTRAAVREEGLHSLAVAPLSSKGKALGTLFAVTRGYREFSDQDVQLLTSIGHQIGVAIENARLFEAERRRAEQFRVISEVGHRIISILAVDELLDQMAGLIKEAFGYYYVGFGLVEGDELVSRAGAGPLWDAYRSLRLKVGRQGVGGWVAQSGQPLLVSDVSQEPRYCLVPQATETRSELCVPLRTKEAVIGVLDVQSDQCNAFDESDLAVLQSLANQAAVAIENARLYEQARQLAVVEERGRLARDLHDAVTQTLFSASLIAEALPMIWESDRDQGRQLLQEIRRLSRGALAEMRTLLLELRPAALAEANLGDLLRQLAEAVAGRKDVSITTAVDRECEVPSDVHVALYRIAQEALNNVVKHSHARQVMVSLHCVRPTPSTALPSQEEARGKRVELCISDDGCGFDPSHVPPDHLGLGIMQERAQAIGAILEVKSWPGTGTQIVVIWQGDE